MKAPVFSFLLTLAASSAAPAAAAEKFVLRYFFDRDKESLQIVDFRFLTAKRAVGIGILDSEDRRRGTLIETSDGGQSWQLTPFKDIPRSLYFLNDSLGWIAAESGIWFTEEGGRTWKKIKSLRGVARVHFLDGKNGFAVGAPKLFLRSSDGGASWSKEPEGDKPETRPETTAYTGIAFQGQRGLVTGFTIRPRRSRFPSWMEPDELRVEKPGVLIAFETLDGGKTWTSTTVSIFGRITRLTMSETHAYSALAFDDLFEYPGEVFRLKLGAKSSERVFREKDRFVTDVWAAPGGDVWLAGIEPAVKLRGAPIPGPVKVFRSRSRPDSLTIWEPVEVDYRATANRVMIAASPDGSIWLATDAGMILSRPSDSQ